MTFSPLLVPLRVLIDPVDGVAASVAARRWILPLILLSVSVALSGAAVSARWDATSTVVRQLAKSGELTKLSEREVAEKTQTTERIQLISGVAKGLVVAPLGVLLIAVALKLAAWLFGTSATFTRCFAAAAIAMLPIAVYHLLMALAVMRQVGVTPAQLQTLLPASLAALRPDAPAKWLRVLGTIDFFNLWSAALLGLGFSTASGMRRDRGLLVGLALYAMFASVVLIGIPGLLGESAT